MATPKPENKSVVCSVCGLDWKQHKASAKGKVPLDECVRLLKMEIAKPRTNYLSHGVFNYANGSSGGDFTATVI